MKNVKCQKLSGTVFRFDGIENVYVNDKTRSLLEGNINAINPLEKKRSSNEKNIF